MAHSLPPPVAAYFAATSPADIAACFTADATVVDERRTHRGFAEILRWREEVAKISFQTEILSWTGAGDQVAVSCRIAGDFPGSPVDLRNTFTLSGDRIAALEIA